MPTTDFAVRVGQSDVISMQLLTDSNNDGVAETPINLSAADHLELVLINKDTNGTTTYDSSSSSKFSVLAGTAGSVQFTPDGTADLSLTTQGRTNIYNGYIWVYSTASRNFSVPEEHEITIRVRP